VRSLAADAGTAAIRGVDAGDDGTVFVAIERAAIAGGEPTLAITALAGPSAPARWAWSAPASGGPVAAAGTRVIAAVVPRAGATTIAIGDRALATRGAPGAALIGLDAATGAVAWTLPVGATEWSVVAAIDGAPDGDAIAVGSFAGTLRAGDRVVTSAGSSDGFALRVDAAGAVRWLVRMGGASADGLSAVAFAPGSPDRLAVAGSITGNADFRGTALAARDPDAATTDAVVAALDPTGLPRWGRVHGGEGQDAAAGVALLADGSVALAATVREVVHAGGDLHVVRGASDTLVVVHAADGAPRGSTLIGGQDYDGARGLVVAPGDELVAGGWFSGTLRTPTGDVLAGGGDDAYVAHLSRDARIHAFDIVSGDGREEVAALGASAAGVAVAIGYTAATTVAGTALPAPADPGGGAAVVFFP
jgi:hypothetical protein